MGKINTNRTIKNIALGILLVIFCNCKRVPEISVVSKKDTISNVVIRDVVNAKVLTKSIKKDTVVVVIPAKKEEVSTITIPTNVNPISLQKSYLSQVGVREATGHNDGKDVEKYLKCVGLGKGYAWCSAFVKWNLIQAQIPNTITAWSPSAENKDYFILQKHKFLEEPKAGDVGTLYFPRMKRIGHTFFFNRKINSSSYESVEGNTNSGGSREGDGVYKKIRSFNATYSISRWEK